MRHKETVKGKKKGVVLLQIKIEFFAMYESRQGSVASNDAPLFCTFYEHLQLAENPTTRILLKERSAKTAIYHVNQARRTVLTPD